MTRHNITRDNSLKRTAYWNQLPDSVIIIDGDRLTVEVGWLGLRANSWRSPGVEFSLIK